MKKSIFLFFAAILCAMSLQGANGTTTVYFKNTVNWGKVYVYFYKGEYWSDSNGSGSSTGGNCVSGPKEMTFDEKLGLYKYTYTGTYTQYISFTKDKQDNYGNFWQTEAVYRTDYNANAPVYVPSTTSSGTKNSNVKYYNNGSWEPLLSEGTITVYFNNTVNWSDVYVYFYKGEYWSASNGSGSSTDGNCISGPNKMTYDSNLKLYKYTYTGKYCQNISFTKDEQSNYGNFWQTEAVYRTDFNSAKPVYTPKTTSSGTLNQNVKYYNTGSWDVLKYSVTIKNDGNGTTDPSGEQSNVTEADGLVIKATASDNYEFVNWTITTGTGSFDNENATSTTFYPTSNATIQANFRSTLTYSLTVQGGTGIESVTGDNNNVTLGESYAITATLTDGYKFVGWTADVAANAEIANASAASTSVVVKNGSVVLTASATEIMSTLTTANTYDKGTPTIDKPTASAAEIGIATTATVTAATNEDYVVASWTLENCVRTDAGEANAKTITVKANGDGAAATVTANYEMIKYYIAGSLPAITWTPGDHALTENSGVHSMTFTNLPAGPYEFKITKGASWATQWGYDDLDYPYVGVSGSGDDGQNVKITLSEAKTITIKFDSNTKKISFEGLTIDGDVVTYSYYIADNGSLSGNSNWSSKSIGLTDDNSDGIYEKTFTNQAIGTYLMKVTNGTWDEGYVWGFSDVEGAYKEVAAAASDNNIEIKLTAATTFTVKFNSNSKKISFDGLTPLIKQNLKYTVTVPKGTTKCYLVGLGDWNNFREMTQDPGNNRIFTLTVNDVYVTDEYKYSASNNWDNAEVDVNNDEVGNRKWSESDVVVKWKGIDLVPEALTYTVTVPAGTEECYIAGTMNGWAFTAMEKSITTPNTFTIDIANANEAHEYKYACKQNWDYAEVNADGSSVSNRTYSANDVVAKWGYPTYTVAGNNRIVFGEEWAPAKADNDMVDQGDGTYKWTKSQIALKKNTEIKFKVVKNHDWEKGSWPGEDWVINTISKDGYYTITIIFKESDQSITATATWTGEAPFKDFSNQPATLYFHPSFHWTSDHAQFAVYFYNEGFGADAEPTWVNMTDSDGDGVYEVANAKQHEYVIICRMNPSRTENKWDDNVMWNQIESGITIPNTAGELNTCLAFWTNCQGDVPTSECTWVAPTPLTDKNWADFVTAYVGKKINAVVERSFKSGQYHTLCLPFDIPTDWLGEGTEAYQLTSIVANNTGDKLSLKATKWNTIVAGQPYIIVPVKGSEYEHVIINGVTVKNVSAGTNVASGDGYKATLKAVTATDGTQTNGSTEYYVGANDGKLYNTKTNKLGLRAIIELTTTGGLPLPPKVRAFVAAGENVETGVDNIVTTDAPVKVIENGQLIIIREGVKYNVQGQKL